MNVDIRTVHFDISDRTKEYIDKKLDRIDFAKDYIIDFILSFTKEKNSLYKTDCTINFRWGKSTHIGTEAHDLIEAIDKLFDKTVNKVTKEKNKVQEH